MIGFILSCIAFITAFYSLQIARKNMKTLGRNIAYINAVREVLEEYPEAKYKISEKLKKMGLQK